MLSELDDVAIDEQLLVACGDKNIVDHTAVATDDIKQEVASVAHLEEQDVCVNARHRAKSVHIEEFCEVDRERLVIFSLSTDGKDPTNEPRQL